MVTGPSGLSGVTVPSRAAVVFRDAGDRVQIHLPAMADEIALENQRSCRAATPEGAQVTCLASLLCFIYQKKSKMITKSMQ